MKTKKSTTEVFTDEKDTNHSVYAGLCVRFFAYFKIKRLLLEKYQIEHYTGIEKDNNPFFPVRYCEIIKQLEYYGL